MENFLNDETKPVSEWLDDKVLVFFLVGRLMGLIVGAELLLADFRTGVFLGDARGKR